MTTNKAPLRDYRFVLEEVLDIGQFATLPEYEEATADMLAAALEAGGRFCDEALHPHNRIGEPKPE